MKSQEVVKLAKQFNKLAQQADPYNATLRNNLVNKPLDDSGRSFPWRAVANVVLKDLTNLDPNEQDQSITAASHGIMDILNDTKVPDPTAMINAANNALSVIKTKIPGNNNSVQIASFFVNLTNNLVKKYFGGVAQQVDYKTKSNEVSVNQQPSIPPTPQSNEANQEQPKKQESLSQFLVRTYQTLRSGKQLTPVDVAQFNANKSFYTRRLNGLNSLQTRTPAQESEKAVIQFALNKVV